MTFNYSNILKFELSVESLQKLSVFVQDQSETPESGGILLGRYIKDCEDIVVDDVTIPMDGDKQSRYSFYRAQKNHQKIIDAEWEKSNGTCNSLGEWHSHPEPYPSPSRLDLSGWRKKIKQDIYDHNALYFVIVGQKQINVWRGDKDTMKIEKLSLLDTKDDQRKEK